MTIPVVNIPHTLLVTKTKTNTTNNNKTFTMGGPSNTNDQSSSSVTRQNVYIVRYGLTEFPLEPHVGPFNSPLHHIDGMEHAQAIAGRIQKDVMESSSSCSEPVHVYSSPFTRTAQTAEVIASSLPAGAQVRIEEGLMEWQQRSLLVEPDGTVTYPKTKKELSVDLDNFDYHYKSANPQAACSPGDDDFVEESEQDLFERCSQTLDGILLNSACRGESFVIVSHAPCDQSMAVYLEGKTLGDSSLSPWPLGGITKFSRVVHEDGSFGPWEMELYGNTEHMPGMYKPGLKAWSLPILTKQAALESDFDEVPFLQVAQ
jgi:broad specificity phosphatase PhoE